ncbi:MAG TPA: 50S ribosomal protein L4 [Candidatus Methanofastidiosa archaeon]|nr:50S ribosomal protein L4 [Candidatus Methanofastidiosa archaeon]HPR42349.1 50S ribosomal protein L4 [Candidatus Methanofastidiosa archaeon]
MKCNIYSLDGKVSGTMELPRVFSTEYRPDLIRRSVLSSISSRAQPYGPDPLSGKKTSAESLGKNRGIARLPRMKSGPRRGAFVPQTIGGRRAHPPVPEKIIKEKINKKERRLALMSAIAASANAERVRERGHRIDENLVLPLVLEDEFETVKKTKDTRDIFKVIGVWDDVLRAREKKIRAGRGKTRGRKYKRKKGPLVIVSRNQGIYLGARNHPGIDIVEVEKLSTEHLAPGSEAGRLVVWTKSALEMLDKMFGGN